MKLLTQRQNGLVPFGKAFTIVLGIGIATSISAFAGAADNAPYLRCVPGVYNYANPNASSNDGELCNWLLTPMGTTDGEDLSLVQLIPEHDNNPPLANPRYNPTGGTHYDESALLCRNGTSPDSGECVSYVRYVYQDGDTQTALAYGGEGMYCPALQDPGSADTIPLSSYLEFESDDVTTMGVNMDAKSGPATPQQTTITELNSRVFKLSGAKTASGQGGAIAYPSFEVGRITEYSAAYPVSGKNEQSNRLASGAAAPYDASENIYGSWMGAAQQLHADGIGGDLCDPILGRRTTQAALGLWTPGNVFAEEDMDALPEKFCSPSAYSVCYMQGSSTSPVELHRGHIVRREVINDTPLAEEVVKGGILLFEITDYNQMSGFSQTFSTFDGLEPKILDTGASFGVEIEKEYSAAANGLVSKMKCEVPPGETGPGGWSNPNLTGNAKGDVPYVNLEEGRAECSAWLLSYKYSHPLLSDGSGRTSHPTWGSLGHGSALDGNGCCDPILEGADDSLHPNLIKNPKCQKGGFEFYVESANIATFLGYTIQGGVFSVSSEKQYIPTYTQAHAEDLEQLGIDNVLWANDTCYGNGPGQPGDGSCTHDGKTLYMSVLGSRDADYSCTGYDWAQGIGLDNPYDWTNDAFCPGYMFPVSCTTAQGATRDFMYVSHDSMKI